MGCQDDALYAACEAEVELSASCECAEARQIKGFVADASPDCPTVSSVGVRFATNPNSPMRRMLAVSSPVFSEE
jgi:hypothetical protein